jgi:branched-chain amino acid aminotransferase
MPLASIDGALMEAAEATIPATDEGFLRGDGVFEAVRLYGGRPYALDEHLARMGDSGERLRLPVDADALRREAEALVAAEEPGDALLRIVLTRGGRRVILVEALPDHSSPIALGVVTYAPVRLLDGIESISYAANMLATRCAKERGFDEALLATPHGRILEAPTSTLFYVLDGELCTPPLSDHVLDSITRRRLLPLAREVPVALDELRRASEAFVASTLREVTPVHAIDGRTLPAAPGPWTERAAARLREAIAAEVGPLARA